MIAPRGELCPVCAIWIKSINLSDELALHYWRHKLEQLAEEKREEAILNQKDSNG